MRRRRPAKRSQKNAEDEEQMLEFLYQDELTESEIAECVPNGKLSIQCFICGLQMSKIFQLREHIVKHEHELVESYDEGTFEKAPIHEILNPQKLNIETTIIRDFVMGEVKAKRYSQFYGILTEADVELHISDSETDDDDDDGNRDKNFEVETANTKYKNNTYKCDLCNLVFDRRYKALFHQKTEHSKNSLLSKCDYCGQRFIGVQLLIHHLRNQCESDEYPISCVERFQQHLIKVNVQQFQCLDEARNELKIRRFTTAEKCFSCKECDKTFLRAEHLNRHMETVHLPEELKLECLVCFKKFNRTDNLRSHMKVHLKEAAEQDDNSNNQAILCQICGHCFTSKSNYVVHMRRHTGEKPYNCDVCGKGFPKSTDLNTHKTKHTGERNFICKICNRAFARAAVLSKHMRVHEGPYSCNYCNCNESFKRPNELANHLRNHAACLTYICNICKSQFASREELEAHCETCVQNSSDAAAAEAPKSKNKRTKKEKKEKAPKKNKKAKALTKPTTSSSALGSSTNESVLMANLSSSTDIENTNTAIKTEQKAFAQ